MFVFFCNFLPDYKEFNRRDNKEFNRRDNNFHSISFPAGNKDS